MSPQLLKQKTMATLFRGKSDGKLYTIQYFRPSSGSPVEEGFYANTWNSNAVSKLNYLKSDHPTDWNPLGWRDTNFDIVGETLDQ